MHLKLHTELPLKKGSTLAVGALHLGRVALPQVWISPSQCLCDKQASQTTRDVHALLPTARQLLLCHHLVPSQPSSSLKGLSSWFRNASSRFRNVLF